MLFRTFWTLPVSYKLGTERYNKYKKNNAESVNIAVFKLYLKVFGFENYNKIQTLIKEYNKDLKYTSEKNNSKYDLVIGPIENTEANKLVSYFITKGYKETEIFID